MATNFSKKFGLYKIPNLSVFSVSPLAPNNNALSSKSPLNDVEY